jgi:hypothetical protein
MTSPRLLTILAIVIWAGVAVTATPRALCHRHSANIATSSMSRADSPAADCSDLHIRFDHRDAILQSEERTFAKSEAPVLQVEAESNGGIHVQGWDKDTYSATLCKAAEAGTDADSTLSQIHLTFQNGKLGIAGPSSHERWSAHLLLRAPKAAAIELHLNNGPLSIHGVDGKLKVRAVNGPVTVTDCTGELDLNSHNGPVTLEGNSGKQAVHTENGPVTLSLSGDSWDGPGVEAHATNGPITLSIPSGYRSGVVLESDGHSPFLCGASVCSEGRKTWDEEHKRMEFGSGPTLVRVSTVNGPVSVR